MADPRGGSFCSAPTGTERTSTIGWEKATNPLLRAPDADTFAAQLVAGLGSYPAYFARLAEVNRRGPDVVAAPALVPLNVSTVQRLLADGAVALDVRPVAVVAAGHLPGAVAIPLRAQLATWLGWLLDPAVPIIIIRDTDQDPADILWPALNIGYENIVGELAGGMPAWRETGGQILTTPLVHANQVTGPVLDVRQDAEYAAGHLPAAVHIELGELPGRVDTVPDAPVTVMCGHGERAMTAASLLERAGRRDLAVLVGGADDWVNATGRPLREGSR